MTCQYCDAVRSNERAKCVECGRFPTVNFTQPEVKPSDKFVTTAMAIVIREDGGSC